MLVTVSNYGVASVWESMDGGSTWTSLDNNGVNLPDMPIRWGIFLPKGYNVGPGETTNGIMLATELGIWTTLSTNGTSTSWTTNNGGLANVRTDMLVLRKSDKTIVAATHGRGMFTTLVPTILPISLLDFKGKMDNGHINLDWTTVMEKNVKHFELQKSFNGVDYFTLGKIKAAGNSNSAKKYDFKDLHINESNYYRLKIEEENGYSTMSKVVLLKKAGGVQQNMTVLNNPITDFINLRFTKRSNQLQLQLYNLNDVLVNEKHFTNSAEHVKWNFSKYLIAGTYILRVYADGELFTAKVIKN
jgi:hypothetical protein